jgi:nucleotide-binding universal stress UspA family protein
MAFHNITVMLDDSTQSEIRQACAMSLAKEHGAFLTGFCATGMLRTANVGPILGGSSEIDTYVAETVDRMDATFREQLIFARLQGEFRVVGDHPTEAVIRQARLSDLVVFGQIDPNHPPPAGRRLLVNALLTSGRPILIVPYAGHFPTVGTNATIAWKDSREAARAVHDALPLLVKARSVTVLHAFVAGKKEPDEAVTDGIVRFLSRHDIDAKVIRFPMAEISVTDAMLSYAADIGADLLVAGGYGHSRLREFVLGGVTRELLQHMTVPVLMSH